MYHQPSRYQVAKDRLAAAFRALRGRDSQSSDQTTATGYIINDPDRDRYNRLWAEPLEHDLLVEEYEKILIDHPIVEAALREFAEGAVGSGFNVHVKNAVGNSEEVKQRLISKARRIINRTKKNCQLEKELSEIAYRAVSFGDAIIQITGTEFSKEIADILLMPNKGMVRNTNERDEFIPGKPQFFQRTNARKDETPFNEGQIIHVRFNHHKGQRYGNSILLAGRAMCKDSLAALRSLLPRRLANQPFRHFNIPKGITATLFNQIKQNLSRLLHIIKGGQTSPWDDVFTNNVDVEVKGGADSDVGDLKDIEMLLDAILMLIGVSRQILGAGTNVNRDVLDEQREELYKKQRRLVRLLIEQFLRPLFDMALAMEGIDPSCVEYEIEFADQYTDSRMERRIDRVIQLFDRKMIDIEDSMPVVAPYLGIKDVKGATMRAKKLLGQVDQQENQLEQPAQPKQLSPSEQPSDPNRKAKQFNEIEMKQMANVTADDVSDAMSWWGDLDSDQTN